jgi:DNA-binding MarR family transcriptional regulator
LSAPASEKNIAARNRLEDRGLIARERDKADRRMITVRITDAGLKLLKGLDQPLVELHERQLGHLGL